MTMTSEETRNGSATQMDLATKVGGVETELTERIHALEVGQATQTATAAGMDATNAAVTAGMQATQAAMQAGTWSTMTVGAVGFIVGSILGALVIGVRRS
jgi:hypothetical protein